MRRLRVKQPGPRTTVEDLGRIGVARYGVPPGGAFDGLALRAANRLVGNADGAAGLELTLLGPILENVGDEEVQVALVGTSLDATVAHGKERRLEPAGRAFRLRPSEVLRLAMPLRSARGWLAFGGGVAVPEVLGGRGTYAPGRFGGFEGRFLAAGDELPLGESRGVPSNGTWTDPAADDPGVLGLLPGPQVSSFGPGVLERLAEVRWTVGPASDRTGVRLSCPDRAEAPALSPPAGIAPEGTTLGAIQIPPDGHPILLGPDRPITGGYGKPALVARVHLGRLAALKPGDTVRFRALELDEARVLERQRQTSLPDAAEGRTT